MLGYWVEPLPQQNENILIEQLEDDSSVASSVKSIITIEMDATSESEKCSELMGMNNMWLAIQNVEDVEDSEDFNVSSTVKDEELRKENVELSLNLQIIEQRFDEDGDVSLAIHEGPYWGRSMFRTEK